MGQGKDFTWGVTKLLYSKLAVDQGWRGASMRVAAGGRGVGGDGVDHSLLLLQK